MSDHDESPVDDARLRCLIDVVIDGEATDDEVRELDTMLQADAELRRIYREIADVHADLRWMHRASDNGERLAPLTDIADIDAAAPSGHSLSNPTETALAGGTVRSQIWRVARPAGAGRWAAAALICGLLATLGGAIVYRGVVRQREQTTRGPEVVAELQFDRGCTWVETARPSADGAALHSGQNLMLVKGAAKLLFSRGAAVVLQGPAEIQLVSASSVRLVHGTIAVRVNGPHKEFVVTSVDASIVDLGTSFGVHRSPQGATEVEVFEGAVEVFPEGEQSDGRVLGVGTSALVRGDGRERGTPSIDVTGSATDHFGNLLELLWEDIVSDVEDDSDRGEEGVVRASFTDGPAPGAVDTFYGSAPGRGWVTPWMGAGNPISDIARENPLSGVDDSYLGVRFYRSFERSIARQYGTRRGFDPTQPHVISWRWRFDGNLDHFNDSFRDRIAFYGNPFFRRNSWPTNSWLIGVVSGGETAGKLRQVFPLRWYVFNGGDGEGGKEFERKNMIDTGMPLKRGGVYRFAVVVYPDDARYDVAIRDDSQTFARTGLSFRDRTAVRSNVLHFSVSADDSADDLSFAVDSIRIESLQDKTIQQQIARETAADSQIGGE